MRFINRELLVGCQHGVRCWWIVLRLAKGQQCRVTRSIVIKALQASAGEFLSLFCDYCGFVGGFTSMLIPILMESGFATAVGRAEDEAAAVWLPPCAAVSFWFASFSAERFVVVEVSETGAFRAALPTSTGWVSAPPAGGVAVWD